MSRVGRMPIDIPAGVNVNLDGHVITVKGPKGELTRTLHQDMKITVADNVITVERPCTARPHPCPYCQHGKRCFGRLQKRTGNRWRWLQSTDER